VTQILIDPGGLERVAQVLDHVAGEYHSIARELRGLPNGPGLIGGWIAVERGWVASGLDGQAASLSHIACRLRDRARYAREADTDSRPRPPFPGGPPRWPLLLPQSNYGPSLPGRLGVRKGVGNQMNHTLYATAPRSGSNVGVIVLVLGAVALAVGILANAAGNGGTDTKSGSDTRDKSKSAAGQSVAGNPAPSPPAGSKLTPDSQQVGADRVRRVADYFGGEKAGVKINQPITVDNVGATDVDVEVPSRGIYAEVGGPFKDADLSRFGSQLKVLKTYAAQHGGRAMFFYDRGTPDRVIEFAAQRLGAENVQPIP
jgi:hypothetical protein